MDSLYEQLYVRKKDIKIRLYQFLIMAATFIVAGAAFFVFGIFIPAAGFIGASFGRMLGGLAIIGSVYLGYKQFIKLDVEFEYIYLSGEIDFDKIMAKSTRKRLLTVKCDKVERFGEYTDTSKEKFQSEHFDKRFDFRSNTDQKVYFMILKHKEHGKILVLFEPEERILKDMKRFMKNVSL